MAARFLVRLLLLLAAAAASATASAPLATNATAASPGDGNVTGFSFSGFDPANRGAEVTVLGDASISKGALQITPDTMNDPATFLTNKSGRVLYATPFKLWHRDGNATSVASFSTAFTINIYRPNNAEPAEGLAFVIVPNSDDPPTGSSTNAATDGNATNQIVAVELDTEKQDYDPDDNHVGLNVNSVVSVATAPLGPLGIQISPASKPTNYTVWVDYDGAKRRVAVFLAVEGTPKPLQAPVIAAPLDLAAVAAEWSYFGFAASMGTKYELNCVLAWNVTVDKLPCDEDVHVIKKRKMLVLAIGVPVGLTVLAAAAVVAYYVCVVKRRKVHGEESGGGGSAITATSAWRAPLIPTRPPTWKNSAVGSTAQWDTSRRNASTPRRPRASPTSSPSAPSSSRSSPAAARAATSRASISSWIGCGGSTATAARSRPWMRGWKGSLIGSRRSG